VTELIEMFRQLFTPEGLAGLIKWGGYPALTAIIFTETGLMAGFFLPGDSLLVVAGLLAAPSADRPEPLLDIWTLNLLLIPAAIIGDSVGYAIGSKIGPALFKRDDSLLFRKSHLIAARDFYERHGGKTIVIARFVPLIRTFAPVVAGIAGMNYRHFLFYNVFGGIGWIVSMTMIGYGLGSVFPWIPQHIDKVIVVVVVLSILPGVFEYLRNRSAGGGTSEPAYRVAAADDPAAKPVPAEPPASPAENRP
jgi:membrane-associated protein